MSALKITNKKVVTVQDWDDLVTKTYGKPYSFQQQNGCQERGTFEITIPLLDADKYEDTDAYSIFALSFVFRWSDSYL